MLLNYLEYRSNLNFRSLCLLAGLFILVGCSQLPSIDEPANLVVPEGELLEESDFAISIGARSGLITYLGNDGNVYVTDQAGSFQNAITTDANATSFEPLSSAPEIKYYLLPTWSTSGRQLAYAQHYIRDEGGQNVAQLIPASYTIQDDESQTRKSTFSIFSASSDGSGNQELWTGEERPIYMYWAPDGETLSAILQSPSAGALQFVVLDTTDQSVEILDVGAPLFWDWAPSGQQIMTHIGSLNGAERMGLLTLEEQVTEEVFDFDLAGFTSPDISPDGRMAVFPTRAEEDSDDDTWVTVLEFETRNKKVIDRLDGDVFIDATFSPDSQKLAYVASKQTAGPAKGELAVYSLATGSLFVSQEKSVVAFFWSPDGQKIAWFERSNDQSNRYDLYVLDLNTEESVLLMAGLQTTPQFNEVISFHNQYQRSATIWSPDSRTVVFPMFQGDSTKIMAMDASGKIKPREIGDGILSFWSAD
ncbi:MAG: hypothetical protein AAGD96_11830 [Chloroflexota bacterium]